MSITGCHHRLAKLRLYVGLLIGHSLMTLRFQTTLSFPLGLLNALRWVSSHNMLMKTGVSFEKTRVTASRCVICLGAGRRAQLKHTAAALQPINILKGHYILVDAGSICSVDACPIVALMATIPSGKTPEALG